LGITPTAQAEAWGLVGPTARASGVRRDIRIEAPYLTYAEQPVQWVTDSAGDLAARFVVRLNDLLETNRLIRALLAHWPTGDLTARMPRKIKAGEAISRIEAPRGELFYFVKSNGSDMPARIHIRTPTLTNLGSVLTLTLGQKLADVPMILTGVDPCFSCNDRLVILHRGDAPTEQWTWEQLQASATSNHSAP
jgi:NADH-quinone oxidoreductase subunit D